MKVSSTFSKVVESRGKASGRPPQRAELSCAQMRSGRGSKGETLSRGFPLFLSLPCTCAPLRWVGVVALSCLSTPFLWCLPKETVSSRQRKALFLPWRLHHPRERSCLSCRYSSSPDLGAGLGGYLSAQISLTQSAMMLGLRVRGRGGRDPTAPVAAPISAFLWGSTPFLCARAKKWGGTGRTSAVYCPIKRRTRKRRK